MEFYHLKTPHDCLFKTYFMLRKSITSSRLGTCNQLPMFGTFTQIWRKWIIRIFADTFSVDPWFIARLEENVMIAISKNVIQTTTVMVEVVVNFTKLDRGECYLQEQRMWHIFPCMFIHFCCWPLTSQTVRPAGRMLSKRIPRSFYFYHPATLQPSQPT